MFKYTLSEKDIITYMLYYLSSNRKTRNMSKKTLWIYSGCLIMMAIICYAIGDIIASIVISWLTIFLVIYTLFLRNYLMTKAMKELQ
ncbi:membrane protein insertase Oxa1/YidC/SpoIIIJ [Pedobacter cryoconitis]|nr:membrane protein insertase Oxa1/YidC/SpoIIIJ [Pedobacter cryoconitis]